MIYLGDQSLEIPEHYRSIPITKLYKGQMLEFYATAVMGRGSQHAKWSPVCGVAFAPRQVGILNNKTKAKILWDLNLTINAKDFDKDGKLDDIQKVENMQLVYRGLVLQYRFPRFGQTELKQHQRVD